MNRSGKIFFTSLALFFFAVPSAWPQAKPGKAPQTRARQQAQGRENVLVGRISLVDGELLRYVPEEKTWVVAVKDSPFGFEDAIYSGENGKAEFLLPNSTWLRIGPSTQVQMIALKPDATEIDVAVGTARFIDKSSKTVIKATTPFGYAVAEPGSAFDLYVGDESVEVIGIRGKVEFVHDVDGSRYEVIPGSMSILADAHQATAGEGKVDAEWDDWNATRDTMWSKKVDTRGESVKYLPEGISEEAGALDENGRWDRVYYEGEYREAWRPTEVAPDWEPYTVGRWTDYYGDYAWVPDEPFGYVTHHYGNWFWANDYWYWAPPVVSVGIGVPWWGLGFSWYPGRVGWCSSGVDVGWFPLLPWEPFYAYNWWGPRSFVIHNFNHIHNSFDRYRYANRAVIVPQRDLFTTRNLAGVRLAGVNRGGAFGTNFRTIPALGGAALANTGDPGQRFRFTNANPSALPGQAVSARITGNSARFAQARTTVTGTSIRQGAASTRIARPAAGTVTAPRATSRLSSAGSGVRTATQSRALNQNPRGVRAGSRGFAATPATRTGGRTAVQAGRRGAQGGASSQARFGTQGSRAAGSGGSAVSRSGAVAGARSGIGQARTRGTQGSRQQLGGRQGVSRQQYQRSQAGAGGTRQGRIGRGQSGIPQASRRSQGMQRAPGFQRAPQSGRAQGVQRAPRGGEGQGFQGSGGGQGGGPSFQGSPGGRQGGPSHGR